MVEIDKTQNDETTFSNHDQFDVIDYVLVYQNNSNKKLIEYRNIYLKNLISLGLKLRNVYKIKIFLFSGFLIFKI